MKRIGTSYIAEKSSQIGARAVVVTLIFLAAAALAAAQAHSFTLLYSFKGGTDGAFPFAGLVMDATGNLYGTTYSGGGSGSCFGLSGCGTVFKIDTTGKEIVLYSFTGGADGGVPQGGLVLDAGGNLYGTTTFGGNLANCYNFGPLGCGTVFKLDTSGKETILYSFSGGADGAYPEASLVLDSAGNLYGTTSVGGNLNCYHHYGCGTLFMLDATGKKTTLYSFIRRLRGAFPNYAALARDSGGNLYGTTADGGDWGSKCGRGCGTAFMLNTSGDETVIDIFRGSPDGKAPFAGVFRDPAGNIYGTTEYGGGNPPRCNCGTVFKIDPTGKETVLHSFYGWRYRNPDGAQPRGALIQDSAGNLYGTTAAGGGTMNDVGHGTVFKIDATGIETVLHSFCTTYPNCSDGEFPDSGLVQDATGNLYGTTGGGGAGGYGTVFKLVP